ncbi:MAG: sugar phosphate isomerase/epimerase [Bryobacterales bacterium]|nr:sugar phosphate isomerase/epimerase [Bryobacterales bacterium]
MKIDRRSFLAAAGASIAPAFSQQGSIVEMGVEAGSVSQNKWTPIQFMDYLAKIGLQVAMVNVPREMQADPAALKAIREHADKLGLSLILSDGCICPSSSSFNPKFGTPEEQLTQTLEVARALRVKGLRVVVGGFKERPQIEMHAENTLKLVRSMRSRILDSGFKLAIENHGGDFQARELKALVEAGGRDVLGVTLDPGNSLWMMEDPHFTLELLGPYTEVWHLRDTAVWRVPEGVAVRWVNMGEGNVDIDNWVKKLLQMRPGLPVVFENLVSGQPRIIRVFDPATFQDFPKMPASELSRFLALAEKGKPVPAVPLPAGKTRGEQQCDDLEVCVRYTRELLKRI